MTLIIVILALGIAAALSLLRFLSRKPQSPPSPRRRRPIHRTLIATVHDPDGAIDEYVYSESDDHHYHNYNRRSKQELPPYEE